MNAGSEGENGFKLLAICQGRAHRSWKSFGVGGGRPNVGSIGVEDIRPESGQVGLEVTTGIGTRVIKLWDNVCREKKSHLRDLARGCHPT